MSNRYISQGRGYKQAVYPIFLANRYEAIPPYGGCFAVSVYFLPPRELSQAGKREMARIKAMLGVQP